MRIGTIVEHGERTGWLHRWVCRPANSLAGSFAIGVVGPRRFRAEAETRAREDD